MRIIGTWRLRRYQAEGHWSKESGRENTCSGLSILVHAILLSDCALGSCCRSRGDSSVTKVRLHNQGDQSSDPQNPHERPGVGVSEMGRALATKPGGLSLILVTAWLKERTDLHKSPSALHTCVCGVCLPAPLT